MFPRHMDKAIAAEREPSAYESSYEISDKGYGKDNVKILHVRREGQVHHIKEFEVNSHLKLYSNKDYLHG